MNKAKVDVCNANRLEIIRLYEVELNIHGLDHSEARFVQFLMNEVDGVVCPLDGKIIYHNGEVDCSLHEKWKIIRVEKVFLFYEV